MKTSTSTLRFKTWHPQRPTVDGVTRLALTPLLRDSDKLSSPPRALTATDGKETHWIIAAEHVAAFLQQHADTHFVFENVGADFWAIHRLLRQYDKAAARAWRKRIASGRFSSVPLLDQLVRLATAEGDDADTLQRRPLIEIAEDAGIEPDAILIDESQQLDGVTHRCLEQSAEKSLLLLQTYRHLRRHAKKIADSVADGPDVRSDAVQRFGLLTEHLQAAAEVALTRLSRRGVRVDRAVLQRLHEQLQRDQLQVAKRLAQHAPGLLVETDDGFKLTKSGNICRSNTVLDDFLNHAFQKSRRNDPTITLPTTAKENISRSPQDWQPFARECPAVRHWIELERLQKDFQFLPQLDHPRLHPTYTTLLRTGRTSCANPALQGLPRDGGIRELIIPRDGYAFLTVDCQCFELAALAAVCRHRYGKSRLAEILERGQDPHAWTAARLTSMTDAEFRSLRKDEKRRYENMRQRAKAINFGVPGGMSAATLADYSCTAYGITMSLDKAHEFRERFLDEIYPELRLYLADRADRAITLTGRIRAGVSYTQRCNTLFQGLAADAAKHALVQLVASGRRVVLVVHDEFVLEIPCRAGKVDREIVVSIVRQIEAATSEVIGLRVRCDYTISNCFSKHAVRKKEVGDTLSVWSPSKPVR